MSKCISCNSPENLWEIFEDIYYCDECIEKHNLTAKKLEKFPPLPNFTDKLDDFLVFSGLDAFIKTQKNKV